MLIRYLSIEHGVTTDAPFVGARICAIDCKFNCPGCFNQPLRGRDPYVESAYDVLTKIRYGGLDQGIILGGLEWSLQPEEMLTLVTLAIAMDLKVMIYTGHYLSDFLDKFPVLVGKDIYVKIGRYTKELQGYYDSVHDVNIASSNQKIYNLKVFEKHRR